MEGKKYFITICGGFPQLLLPLEQIVVGDQVLLRCLNCAVDLYTQHL
uniref:Uncharacterized protein n=1 Tax=Arundo donax TaxID=35708 RepID=A0A0A9CEF4_ARUDO